MTFFNELILICHCLFTTESIANVPSNYYYTQHLARRPVTRLRCTNYTNFRVLKQKNKFKKNFFTNFLTEVREWEFVFSFFFSKFLHESRVFKSFWAQKKRSRFFVQNPIYYSYNPNEEEDQKIASTRFFSSTRQNQK